MNKYTKEYTEWIDNAEIYTTYKPKDRSVLKRIGVAIIIFIQRTSSPGQHRITG